LSIRKAQVHIKARFTLANSHAIVPAKLWDSAREEQRGLLAIVILVSGVVGGLIVVITVVYIYRLCLKRRPPLSTTAKPERKRYQLQSQAVSQCRPLPLPSHIAEESSALASQPPYQGCTDSQIDVSETSLPLNKIVIEIDEANTPERRRSSVFHSPLISNYLSVDVPPQRARSAEMILLVPDDEDRRRASFELYKKTVQHRRLLPDIEQLKKFVNICFCACIRVQLGYSGGDVLTL
uniref:Tyrosine-protein phosphatase domain-containing protein n=1 Tax=Gongylonema pulchrum TaxID=637853 RepID=A0A183E1D3_9BILA